MLTPKCLYLAMLQWATFGGKTFFFNMEPFIPLVAERSRDTDGLDREAWTHTYGIFFLQYPGSWCFSFMLVAATCHSRRVRLNIDLKGCHILLFSRHWLITALAEPGSVPAFPAHAQHGHFINQCAFLAWILTLWISLQCCKEIASIYLPHGLCFFPPVVLLCVCRRDVVEQRPNSCCAAALLGSDTILQLRNQMFGSWQCMYSKWHPVFSSVAQVQIATCLGGEYWSLLGEKGKWKAVTASQNREPQIRKGLVSVLNIPKGKTDEQAGFLYLLARLIADCF